MFKKLVLATLIALSTVQAASAKPADDKSLIEKVQMKAFLCLYWECPALFMKATGLASLIEMYGQRKAMQSITTARGDARFFADRVILTEPGEMTTDIYSRMIVKIEAGDFVTALGRINTGSGYYIGDVRVNVEGLKLIDTKSSGLRGLKINGRPLISSELAAAHAATQNLIFDGVIKAPNNEFKTATNALLLNKMMLDFVSDR